MALYTAEGADGQTSPGDKDDLGTMRITFCDLSLYKDVLLLNIYDGKQEPHLGLK